jgi:hypothetical protein
MSNLSDAERRLLDCDSYRRTEALCTEMFREPLPAKRLSLFLEYFNMCDAPWPYRGVLACELREALKEVRLEDVLPEDERAWFAALPPIVQIYRGCQKGRERGLSWTARIDVAAGFAIGKRCHNAEPVLMTAVIPKQHILGVSLERREHEIVADPRRLRQLRVHPENDQLLKAERDRRAEKAA